MKKVILIAILFVISIKSIAQNNLISCGTEPIDSTTFYNQPWIGNNQYLENFLDSLGYPLSTSTTVNSIESLIRVKYRVPIKFWVHRRTNGTGGATLSEIKNLMKNLNDNFNISNNTLIGFYMYCNIGYIDNDEGYDVTTNSSARQWNSNYNERGCVNIHLANTIPIINGQVNAGIAYSGTFNTNKFIFLSSNAYNTSGYSATIGHELGHYFGLVHTHQNNDKGTCRKEPVDREREYPFFNTCVSAWFSGKKICEVAGDGLNDTPADPDLTQNTTCSYPGNNGIYLNKTDPWGDFYWRAIPSSRFPLPSTVNIMSYNGGFGCRTKFSRLQIGVMLYNVIHFFGDVSALSDPLAAYDDFELDNDILQWSRIDALISQSHSFHQEIHWPTATQNPITQCDVDWVKYTPLCGGTQEVRTFGMPNKAQANTRLTLFAANGTTQLAQNDDISSTNKFSSITYNFNAFQDYYIRIENMGAQATTYYNILIGELALNEATITSTSGDAICGTPTLGIDIGATLPAGSTIEWEWNAPNGGVNFSCTNCFNPVVSYMGGYGDVTITAKVTIPCGLTDYPITRTFKYGIPPHTYNIVSYPLPWGASEPTCFSSGQFITLKADNVYSNEVSEGWEWGYRYGGVTYTSPHNSQFYTLMTFDVGTYEVFVKHKTACGVSSVESTRTFEIVWDCANGFRTMAAPFTISANPNPAKNTIHLKADYSKTNGKTPKNKVIIELYKSPMNNKVKEWSFNTSSSMYNLNVQGLDAGIYYLLYKDGLNTKTLKIILQ